VQRLALRRQVARDGRLLAVLAAADVEHVVLAETSFAPKPLLREPEARAA
jgi:hypothetical protein